MKILLISLILLYGARQDYVARIIPNKVSLCLLMIGIFFDFSLKSAIIGLIVPMLVFIIANGITHSDFPGGDFKLLCSLGFAIGLFEMVLVIVMTGILVILTLKAKKLSLKRNVPLCTYVAPSYMLVQAVFWVVMYM